MSVRCKVSWTCLFGLITYVRGEGVQGVLTLFCSGAAQVCHDDRVVELKERVVPIVVCDDVVVRRTLVLIAFRRSHCFHRSQFM